MGERGREHAQPLGCATRSCSDECCRWGRCNQCQKSKRWHAQVCKAIQVNSYLIPTDQVLVTTFCQICLQSG